MGLRALRSPPTEAEAAAYAAQRRERRELIEAQRRHEERRRAAKHATKRAKQQQRAERANAQREEEQQRVEKRQRAEQLAFAAVLPVCEQWADGKGDPKRVAPPPKGPGNLRVFRRDQATGELTPTGCVYEVDEPLGIVAAEYERWGA